MQPNEPTLRDLVDILQRGWWPALVAAAVLSVTTFFVSGARPNVYQAQATVVTTFQDPAQRAFGTTLVTAPALSTSTYRAAVLSRPVIERAFVELNGRAPSADEVLALQRAVTVRLEEAQASALLRVSTRAGDPVEAQRRADAVTSAVVAWDVERATRSLETSIESLTAQIASLDEEIVAAPPEQLPGLERARADLTLQLSSARALRTGAVGRLELFEGAVVPRGPISPRPMRDAAIMAVLAVIATFGGLLLWGALDPRVRSPEDVARFTGMPVLAAFPRRRGDRRGLPREAASYLRTGVEFATGDDRRRVVLVTSANEDEGKSSVAIALAMSFARQRYRTLLVDADLRNPVVGTEFGLDVEGVLTLDEVLTAADVRQPTQIAFLDDQRLDVLPCGRGVANPTELLSSAIGPALARFSADYDVVVIDSAPVLPVADTLTIAPHATGVLFVVSVVGSNRKGVDAALSVLRRIGSRFVGAVATNLPVHRANRTTYGYGVDLDVEPTVDARRGRRLAGAE